MARFAAPVNAHSGVVNVESSSQQFEYMRQHYDELVDYTELRAEQ